MNTAAATAPFITEEEYLETELRSEFKREYLGGVVYAMAGASEAHNIIAANLMGMLHARLRGRACQSFGSDMKVRLLPLDSTYYYYPDAMIACDSADSGHGWRERPSALFEIITEETRRIDEREKRLAYLQLATLEAYVRIEQDRAEVVVERRSPEGWRAERLSGSMRWYACRRWRSNCRWRELYERMKFPA